jgi:hypothetical protein
VLIFSISKAGKVGQPVGYIFVRYGHFVVEFGSECTPIFYWNGSSINEFR